MKFPLSDEDRVLLGKQDVIVRPVLFFYLLFTPSPAIFFQRLHQLISHPFSNILYIPAYCLIWHL